MPFGPAFPLTPPDDDAQLAPFRQALAQEGFVVSEELPGATSLFAYWPTAEVPAFELLLLAGEPGQWRAFLSRLATPDGDPARPVVRCFRWQLVATAADLQWLLARAQLWQQARASARPAAGPAPPLASPAAGGGPSPAS